MKAIKVLTADLDSDAHFHLCCHVKQAGNRRQRLWELAWGGQRWYVPHTRLTLDSAKQYLPLLRLLGDSPPTNAMQTLAERGHVLDLDAIEPAFRRHLCHHLNEPAPAWMLRKAPVQAEQKRQARQSFPGLFPSDGLRLRGELVLSPA